MQVNRGKKEKKVIDGVYGLISNFLRMSLQLIRPEKKRPHGISNILALPRFGKNQAVIHSNGAFSSPAKLDTFSRAAESPTTALRQSRGPSMAERGYGIVMCDFWATF